MKLVRELNGFGNPAEPSRAPGPGKAERTLQLLRAIHLACPSLPIGAYAYSQGLEYAVECGWVHDRDSADCWIGGLFEHSVARFDLPLVDRLFCTLGDGDQAGAEFYNAWVLAGRESAELVQEELHLGAALIQLLRSLGYSSEAELFAKRPSYLAAFALAAHHFGLSSHDTLTSYCFAWLEHQTSAATRLIPLGQTDGQLILSGCLHRVENAIQTAQELADAQVGATAFGQALASAQHETQYSRLFRS